MVCPFVRGIAVVFLRSVETGDRCLEGTRFDEFDIGTRIEGFVLVVVKLRDVNHLQRGIVSRSDRFWRVCDIDTSVAKLHLLEFRWRDQRREVTIALGI